MNPTSPTLALQDEMARLHAEFERRNPLSRAAHQRALDVLPGGNTRTVLHFRPFPLTMKSGNGSDVWDIDDHHYIDFVGEFSAGLYGHSDPLIREAVAQALQDGIVLAAPTTREVELAELVRARFPSIEKLRFTNSGTEANILALMAARVYTGRNKILVFEGAYHGGVLAFSVPPNPLNIPLDVVYAPYNDVERACEVIHEHRGDLAAVIVEPILGAAGNLPGTPEFLRALRAATTQAGALLIFDEVKTSRCGAGGIQGQVGVRPDLTSLGKYIGGGLSCGVFGGRADIMARFDPAAAHSLRHAGTFNNNACSMAAGVTGLSRVFTAERADLFNAVCEVLRVELNAYLTAADVPMRMIGHGSMFSAHFVRRPPSRPDQIPAISSRLTALFHMEALLSGLLMANRGDIFVSLPMDDRHFTRLRQTVAGFVDRHAALIRELVPA
ncbi:aspartate aminotransferase family protein [Burkholderia dolosa]|jgi:glutamate-1-semialdehyde 2,1-aminomutase|uniref:aspartate aminotransferase family protein n=2 Tax=Burkholderia dolosa TaxID=152500 RepID=UPI001C93FCF4|nr:aminotransferase class III-fold pyridoxal phosphate-dependent enzyme [Burkholderia dolosa]